MSVPLFIFRRFPGCTGQFPASSKLLRPSFSTFSRVNFHPSTRSFAVTVNRVGSPPALSMHKKKKEPKYPPILVFSGPSGSGKSTLLNRLFAKYPERFGFSVSHTTRKPRAGETDGKDYHFVTQEEFDKLLAQDDYFLEAAGFAGNSYGTSVSSVRGVLDQQRVCTLDIELKGVKTLKTALSSGRLEGLTGVFINIVPPSLEELEQRLRGRGTETEESLRKRLAKAREELEMVKAEKLHDWTVVNGDDRERAFQEFERVVMAEVQKRASQ